MSGFRADLEARVDAQRWTNSAAVPETWLKYGLARIVYALAHDIDPWRVDRTDGGFESIQQAIAERDAADTAQLAVLVGLSPDEADEADVADALYEIAEDRETT